MTVTTFRAFALLALLVVPASLSAQQQDPPQTDTGEQQSQVSTPAAPPRDPGAPLLTLKEAITEKDPQTFARRLSALLGAEVRLPLRIAPPLTLPAGEWSVDDLLEKVGAQVMAVKGVQGSWHPLFVFSRTEKEDPKPVSKLKSAGLVSLNRQDASFSALTYAVVRSIGGRVEVPEGVRGLFSLNCKSQPVEKVMADLASRAGLSLKTGVTFEFDTEGLATGQGTTEEERQIAEGLRYQEEASRPEQEELALMAAVSAATGLEPDDPNFPWDTIDPQIWSSLGFSPEGLDWFRWKMLERNQNNQVTAMLCAALLSGQFGEIGNIDPLTFELNFSPIWNLVTDIEPPLPQLPP